MHQPKYYACRHYTDFIWIKLTTEYGWNWQSFEPKWNWVKKIFKFITMNSVNTERLSPSLVVRVLVAHIAYNHFYFDADFLPCLAIARLLLFFLSDEAMAWLSNNCGYQVWFFQSKYLGSWLLAFGEKPFREPKIDPLPECSLEK